MKNLKLALILITAAAGLQSLQGMKRTNDPNNDPSAKKQKGDDENARDFLSILEELSKTPTTTPAMEADPGTPEMLRPNPFALMVHRGCGGRNTVPKTLQGHVWDEAARVGEIPDQVVVWHIVAQQQPDLLPPILQKKLNTLKNRNTATDIHFRYINK